MAYPNQMITLTEIQSNLNFFSRYPNFLLYTGKEVFRLRDKVDAYLRQPFPTQKEKQVAHGNLLWTLKNYYSTPFQREAIVFQNFNYHQFDLADKDKLNYLNYILTMKNYMRFSSQFFAMLSNYHAQSVNSAEQSCRIFHRIQTLLAKNYKKNENYQQAALRFYPFLCVYAKNCPHVTDKLVNDYMQILFKMSSKFPNKRVSLVPLKDLMERKEEQRRQQAEIKSLFGDEFEPERKGRPQIDKKAVKTVLQQYVTYSLDAEKRGEFDSYLYYSMTSMMKHIVGTYDYKDSEVKALRKELGYRHAMGLQQSRLYKMGLDIQRSFRQSQPIPRKKIPLSVLQKTAMDYYLEH